MTHLGDITKISGEIAPVVDCIIGGSPCQDLSVAGKRAGLGGERSGLFMEQIRIIKEMRAKDAKNGKANIDIRPRYMVWENVPGAFSSNGGEDFRVVLEETAKVADENASIPRPPKGKWSNAGCILDDGWSIAWRVLDAQFWGVPQRRRRIALVADFGGQSAPEILFVRKSVSGDFDEGGETRESPFSDAESRVGADGRKREVFAGNFGLCIRYGNQLEEDKTPTLATSLGDNTMSIVERIVFKGDGSNGGETALSIVGDHENRPTDMTNLVVSLDRAAYNQGKNAQFDIGISDDGVAHTVVAKGPGAVAYACSWDGTDASPTLTANNAGGCQRMPDKDNFNCVIQGVYPEVDSGVVGTLDASYAKMPGCRGGIERTMVYAVDCQNLTEQETNGTLQACAYHNINSNNIVRVNYIVRRLTPLECERLQGYPDRWTDIGEFVDTKGKKRKSSDASRYKALGNSIALPQWKWILKRICGCYERDATMASLFDGIGGFPYLWEQINGKGTCLWASEIDEFPIAVTKERIG